MWKTSKLPQLLGQGQCDILLETPQLTRQVRRAFVSASIIGAGVGVSTMRESHTRTIPSDEAEDIKSYNPLECSSDPKLDPTIARPRILFVWAFAMDHACFPVRVSHALTTESSPPVINKWSWERNTPQKSLTSVGPIFLGEVYMSDKLPGSTKTDPWLSSVENKMSFIWKTPKTDQTTLCINYRCRGRTTGLKREFYVAKDDDSRAESEQGTS